MDTEKAVLYLCKKYCQQCLFLIDKKMNFKFSLKEISNSGTKSIWSFQLVGKSPRNCNVNLKYHESESHVQLFATLWTIESMEFSRPEYWSG